MEELKEQLYKSIANYGLNDIRTIKLSQKLDLVVVEKMKRGGKQHERLS